MPEGDHSSDFTRKPYSKPLIPKDLKWLSEAQQAERESARQREIEGMSYGEMREQDIRCAGCSQSLRGRLILHTEQGPMHDACARDWFFGTGDRDDGIE